MRRAGILLSVLAAALWLSGGASAYAAVNDGSGLPVPRFVTLKASEANMRTGPGEQYPIKWTYQHSGLPLEVIAEYHHWRRVRDWQGAEGWMHSSMLSAKRSFMVTGAQATIRAKPDTASATLARVEPRVTGKIIECPKASDWCRVEIDDIKGWLPRTDLWGVQKDEEID